MWIYLFADKLYCTYFSCFYVATRSLPDGGVLSIRTPTSDTQPAEKMVLAQQKASIIMVETIITWAPRWRLQNLHQNGGCKPYTNMAAAEAAEIIQRIFLLELHTNCCCSEIVLSQWASDESVKKNELLSLIKWVLYVYNYAKEKHENRNMMWHGRNSEWTSYQMNRCIVRNLQYVTFLSNCCLWIYFLL